MIYCGTLQMMFSDDAAYFLTERGPSGNDKPSD